MSNGNSFRLTDKDTNPKDAIGVTKVPYHLVPSTAIAEEAMAFLDGATKYGKYNWRVAGVRASVYIDAMFRHLHDYLNGEELSADSRVKHLAHIRACAGILIDAERNGKLEDDRAPYVDMHAIHEALRFTIEEVKERNAEQNPHQYTIRDVPPPDGDLVGGESEPGEVVPVSSPQCDTYFMHPDGVRERCTYSRPHYGTFHYFPRAGFVDDDGKVIGR